ncbi:MAG: tRNA (adenosine(37)-N6)-dimethylallyltransferase MiaA [Bacteroidetes bacterium]|nr:tRNA (adenosine(37)-N6)-dimethylallyltransferase MiaA [Bacteroidota bacterium]
MITILGPTATGKTAFAAFVASQLNGEVISADSRQVYRRMDLGTGKDYNDYIVDGQVIPYHLVDIAEPGEVYDVYRYQHDFLNAYQDIISRGKLPVLCGGTGMYIEAVLKGYKLIKVPINPERRRFFDTLTNKELENLLASYKSLHNISDVSDRNRLIRALEIQEYYHQNPDPSKDFPHIKSTLFGIYHDRETVRDRITHRLKARLDKGLVDEVKSLLDKGISPEKLKFYGLEYRFLTQYILEEITFDDMFRLLNTAIHQFAKRQMTWFRKMAKAGFLIHWIDGNLPNEEKLNFIISHVVA